MDFPDNQGGKFLDVGLGLNLSVPTGHLAGNLLSLEWLEPVRDDFNGFQIRRRGMLTARWQFNF
jgi:hypothetical protein